MPGDDLLHPALRQAAAQGVDVRIRCLEEMKAADQRPDRLAGKGLLRLPDDDIRPGVTAAVENNQAPVCLKDQALLMGEIIGGILAVAQAVHLPRLALGGQARRGVGEQRDAGGGGEGAGDEADAVGV